MKWLLILVFVELTVARENEFRMPAEWEPHQRTFLSWPQSAAIWTEEFLPYVREDVALIANTIVDFEPVVMLTDPKQVDAVRTLLDPRVGIVPMNVDDLWARDTVPVFVEKNGTKSVFGVDFNFNGWGNKQKHENDAKVAAEVKQFYGMEGQISKIIAEGGSFETDGKGTLLVTESSLVNTNRNSLSRDEIEDELKRVLGMRKVIWFKGVKYEDITDAHVDCLVRFVKPGTVLLSRQFPGEAPDVWSKSSDDALNVLKSSTDADGNPFEVIELFEPDPSEIEVEGDPDSFLASYANFYIGNGFVIVPEFGDKEADLEAQSILQEHFPDRKIVPLQITFLSSGGGGIHCATHDEPSVK